MVRRVPEKVAIAIIAPVQPEDFYDEVWEGVWEATFDLADQHDAARQREILEGLLGRHVDAIAIAPAHTSALDDLIDRHEQRGTRLITFEGDAPASERSAFVGADAERSGALAGEVLAKLMGGRGRVLSFPGEEFQLAGRYAGFRTELGRHSGWIEETAHTLCLDTQEQVCPELQNALKNADGVYVGNKHLARLGGALEQIGVRVPCVGFNNTALARELLRGGLVSAVVDESRRQQGYFAVQKAYQATLRREGLESLSVPSSVAFSANAADLQESLNNAFELLLRQRTAVLCSFKARLEQANAELLSLSITDPLTGCSTAASLKRRSSRRRPGPAATASCRC